MRYRRALLTAYAVALLGATLAPVPGSVYPPHGFDKLIHLALFAVLGVLLYWSLRAPSRPLLAARALGLSAITAGLIELLQGLVPFRDADLGDFAIGTLGALFGVAAAALSEGRRPRAASRDPRRD
jgi:VanZ family protein